MGAPRVPVHCDRVLPPMYFIRSRCNVDFVGRFYMPYNSLQRIKTYSRWSFRVWYEPDWDSLMGVRSSSATIAYEGRS